MSAANSKAMVNFFVTQPLTQEAIDKYAHDAPGVYVLSRGNEEWVKVGSSRLSLRKALQEELAEHGDSNFRLMNCVLRLWTEIEAAQAKLIQHLEPALNSDVPACSSEIEVVIKFQGEDALRPEIKVPIV